MTLGIGAYNGVNSTVVTGRADAVYIVNEYLKKRNVVGRMIRSGFAFHSKDMASVGYEIEVS